MSPPVFAVVGHPNKGKSSIVATLAADDSVRIGPEPGTTRHCRRYPMTVDGRELYALVDTPGFQRARRAWQWLRQHETTADRHPAVVRAFVEAHRASGQFPEECELLDPILAGAGILYVVDGSVPYGEEYEPEMEILRWTGQPSLALINPIGSANYVEPWRNALGQYFKVVRVFNAVMADFHKRTDLLRAFGQLKEDWHDPLERAADLLEKDFAHKRRRAAQAVAGCLAAMLNHRVEKNLPLEADPGSLKPALEERFREELRRHERQCRDRVESIYAHRRIVRREQTLEVTEADLFAERTWVLFGLSRRDLVATGALGGAATGAFVDAHLAGASLLTGAVVGAGIGASLAWWTSGRLVTVKVLNVPLGGKRIVAGPTRNPNFPYVVLNRARFHRLQVALRTHAAQDELALATDPHTALVPIPANRRTEFDRALRRLRKQDPSAVERLTDAIDSLFVQDEKPPEIAPAP